MIGKEQVHRSDWVRSHLEMAHVGETSSWGDRLVQRKGVLEIRSTRTSLSAGDTNVIEKKMEYTEGEVN